MSAHIFSCTSVTLSSYVRERNQAPSDPFPAPSRTPPMLIHYRIPKITQNLTHCSPTSNYYMNKHVDPAFRSEESNHVSNADHSDERSMALLCAWLTWFNLTSQSFAHAQETSISKHLYGHFSSINCKFSLSREPKNAVDVIRCVTQPSPDHCDILPPSPMNRLLSFLLSPQHHQPRPHTTVHELGTQQRGATSTASK